MSRYNYICDEVMEMYKEQLLQRIQIRAQAMIEEEVIALAPQMEITIQDILKGEPSNVSINFYFHEKHKV